MDRITAAARATRAAQAKGHTLGEWRPDGEDSSVEFATCTLCPHEAHIATYNAHGGYTYGGGVTLYLCRPSGEMRGPFHTQED